MESLLLNEKKKNKGILTKTWKNCKQSLTQSASPKSPRSPIRPLSCPSSPMGLWADKWAGPFNNARKMARSKSALEVGHFAVYVGPDRQRFVIKVKYTSHPLFKMLLEEAELEYGFDNNGPLVLPCEVGLFLKVLLEMESDDGDDYVNKLGCKINKSCSRYHVLTPSKLVSLNQL